MLTRFIRMGYAPEDTERQRRTKSVFVLVMVLVILMDLEYVLFRDRSILDLTIDGWIFVGSAGGLILLYATSRLLPAYLFFTAMILPAFTVELWVVGNKHGALYAFAIISIWSIWIVGPRRSIVLFSICFAAVAIAAIIDPYLPHTSTAWHVTAGNPEGWLFHDPEKEPIGRDEVMTFLFGLGLLYMGMYSAQQALNQANARIENLLCNVLPPSIAARLTDRDEDDFLGGGATIADAHNEATILFADIVGFTEIASKMPPDEVVSLLDRIFGAFDNLAEAHEVEKIKTIGDAYMAVCGLPEPNARHAENVMELAIAMLETVGHIRTEAGAQIRLRIGINSGPVVAGIIGRRRFLYDLWGDAVNTASRMESHGEADTIQVAENTYEVLKGAYEFKSLGTIEVKGKGQLPVWRFYRRRRPVAAVNKTAAAS